MKAQQAFMTVVVTQHKLDSVPRKVIHSQVLAHSIVHK